MTPVPTPTATSITANDAAVIVSVPGPLHVNGNTNFVITLTVQNTGSSTWMMGYGPTDYYVVNTNYVGNVSTNYASTIGPVAPGQQVSFTITMSEDATGTLHTVDAHWSLEHGGVHFGPDMYVPITVAGFAPILTEAAPGCSDPSGVSWAWWGASGGNAIGCGGGGLVMSQGNASVYPRAALTSVNGSYDGTTVRTYVHVHFTSTSASAIGTLMVRLPSSSSGCDGTGIGISPNGTVRTVNINSSCQLFDGALETLPASTDWTLEVEIYQGNFYYFVNGGQVVEGGAFAAGPYVGVMVIDPATSGANVAFSNFEVDQWKS